MSDLALLGKSLYGGSLKLATPISSRKIAQYVVKEHTFHTLEPVSAAAAKPEKKLVTPKKATKKRQFAIEDVKVDVSVSVSAGKKAKKMCEGFHPINPGEPCSLPVCSKSTMYCLKHKKLAKEMGTSEAKRHRK